MLSNNAVHTGNALGALTAPINDGVARGKRAVRVGGSLKKYETIDQGEIPFMLLGIDPATAN